MVWEISVSCLHWKRTTIWCCIFLLIHILRFFMIYENVCYDMWRQYVSMRYHPCKNSIAIREGRVKLNFNYTFHTRKWIWIWLLYKKGVHYCSGLDLLTVVPVHQTITRFETPRTVHLSHLICFFLWTVSTGCSCRHSPLCFNILSRNKWLRLADDILNAFSWMKLTKFQLKIYSNLFLGGQLTRSRTCGKPFPECFPEWSLMHMMTWSNGDIFRVTGHLCGEFTGPRWIPHTKASDVELWCFLSSTSE